MITTGSLDGYQNTNTEIIDLILDKTWTKTCSDLPNFPSEIDGAVGGWLLGTPIVCGGGNGSVYGYSDKCYKFTKTNSLGGWQEFASMKHGNKRGAGIVYRNKFHIFGGFKGGFYNSSEIISEDGGVEVGPDLPTELTGHSITAINETVSILSGGFEGIEGESSKTWYYNHETKKFTSGPTLLEVRSNHGSATNVDRVTKEKIPIVTGGINIQLGGILSSTELLKNGKWQKGTIQCMKQNV